MAARAGADRRGAGQRRSIGKEVAAIGPSAKSCHLHFRPGEGLCRVILISGRTDGACVSKQATVSDADQVFATKLLRLMVDKTSSELGTFSSWLVAGAAAFFGLLLNAIDKLGSVVNLQALPLSMKLFLIAVMLNVLQRVLAAMVAGSVKAAQAAELLAKEALTDGPAFTLSGVTKLIERSFWPPARWLIRHGNRRVLQHDFVSSAAFLVKLTQIQWYLMFVQIALLAAAIWILFPKT